MSKSALKEQPKKTGIKAWLKNAFATSDPNFEYSDEDEELLERMAKWVSERGLSTPAILFLESFRPLGYLGGQAMVMAEPIVDMSFASFPGLVKKTFSMKDYNRFIQLLERREVVEKIIDKITRLENQRKRAERKKREEKKK